METKKDDVINFHIEKDLPVIKFWIEDDVPASEQMERFEKWLEDNKPSQAQIDSKKSIYLYFRSIEWKCSDEEYKIRLSALDEWRSLPEDDKTMKTVYEIADKYEIKGGMWMYYLEKDTIDVNVDIKWRKLARSLIKGELGSVLSLKVGMSGAHNCITFFTPDEKDREDIEKTRYLIREAGITGNLYYKPNILQSLQINRNNPWGIRTTKYFSLGDKRQRQMPKLKLLPRTVNDPVLQVESEEDVEPGIELVQPSISYNKQELMAMARSPFCRETPTSWTEIVKVMPGVVRTHPQGDGGPPGCE